MFLSQAQIEEIATAITDDFNNTAEPTMASTNIDKLAHNYLHLDVRYENLSFTNGFFGLTAYSDTKIVLGNSEVALSQNEILLDKLFKNTQYKSNLWNRRRFTLAHECAHQILYSMESDSEKAKIKQRYSMRTVHTAKALKTREDWNEWQANALGAAILMPKYNAILYMWHIAKDKQIKYYDGGWLRKADSEILEKFCANFGVSQQAALIRLRKLGFVEDRPYYEYLDPIGIWA